MSTEKRDLTDLLKYEGKINEGRNLYEFPTLYRLTKTGKIRTWNIYVRLIKTPKKSDRKINWNELKDEQLPIKKEYISGEKNIPPNSVGQYWTVSGELNGKKTRHPPSYERAVNIGRANERNALQTAIIRARNKYKKRVEHGDGISIKSITDKITEKGEKNVRYFPMLPTKYIEKYTKIIYPCYVQPKLDGTRVLAYLYKNKKDSEVILYTRELKDVLGKDRIKTQLKPILEKMYDNKLKESLYIDFEFYKFGKPLQDISGNLRNEKIISDIQSWIFDVFYPSVLLEVQFNERIKWIYKIFELDNTLKNEIKYLTFKFNKDKILENYKEWLDRLEKNNKKATEEEKKKMFKKEKGIDSIESAYKLYKDLKELNVPKNLREFEVPIHRSIAEVPTLIAKNRIEEEYIYRGFLVLGFEGAIIRNMNGLYRADSKSKTSYLRSIDVQKRKPVFSEEYPIENFTSGTKGRDKNALLWICITENEKIFKVTPKGVTVEQRKKLYNKFIKNRKLFNDKYKGQMITIEFEGKSRDGIPQRAKALGLRPFL